MGSTLFALGLRPIAVGARYERLEAGSNGVRSKRAARSDVQVAGASPQPTGHRGPWNASARSALPRLCWRSADAGGDRWGHLAGFCGARSFRDRLFMGLGLESDPHTKPVRSGPRPISHPCNLWYHTHIPSFVCSPGPRPERVRKAPRAWQKEPT